MPACRTPRAPSLAVLLLAALVCSRVAPVGAAADPPAANLALPSTLSDLCAAVVDGEALPSEGFTQQVRSRWRSPRPRSLHIRAAGRSAAATHARRTSLRPHHVGRTWARCSACRRRQLTGATSGAGTLWLLLPLMQEGHGTKQPDVTAAAACLLTFLHPPPARPAAQVWQHEQPGPRAAAAGWLWRRAGRLVRWGCFPSLHCTCTRCAAPRSRTAPQPGAAHHGAAARAPCLPSPPGLRLPAGRWRF